ncbi:MAG: tetratricopeptide repeat protein [Anaerolineales bacterium]|nr:tetratricopeptide repeat protein [Anaerolineales bacterium]
MPGSEETFRKFMNQGHSAAWDQRWDRAEEFYRKALEAVPDQPRALINLGLALFEQEKFEDALKFYMRAADVSSGDPLPVEKSAEILERLGMLNKAAEQSMKAADLYLKVKDADKAIENWTRVVRVLPEYQVAHSRLALVHERLGRTQQAITEYLAVAALQQQAGHQDQALGTVQHALELNPDSKEAQQALKMVQGHKLLPKPMRQPGATGPLRMARVRQLKDKEEDRQEAGESPDPISEARQKALTALAGLLFDVPDTSTAEEPQERQGGLGGITRMVTGSLVSQGPDRTRIAMHLGQAVDLQTRGENLQAMEELNRAIEAGLDHPSAHFDLGLLLVESGDKDTAQRHLGRSVKHADFGLASRLMVGEYLREKARLNQAVEEYLEALKIADASVVSPDRADEMRQLYEPLIEALSQEEDEQKLVNLCDNIHELLLRPNWRMHLRQARSQLPGNENGGPPVPLAEMLTEAKSSMVVEALGHINQLAREGFLRSAMEEAFSVLDHAPTYLPLHVQMGELLLRLERTVEAIDKFNTVAQTYSARGEAGRATDLYRRIVNISPMDLAARTQLIDQLVDRGEIEQALEEYLHLADVYYRLAELDMARSTYERALRQAQQSNVDRSWNVRVLHRMADIDLQRLDWRQAMRVYDQLRTLEPEDEVARTKLIDLSMRLGQDNKAINELDNYLSHLESQAKEQQSLDYLNKLVDEFPEYLFARRRLAELYQQSAQIEEAVAQWDLIGKALMKAGNKEGAVAAIRQILVLNPPNAAKYEQFLRKLGA